MRISAIAGAFTLLQAAGQITYTALGVLQYFCLVDFMKIPLLVYIKILYFHEKSTCGATIDIGKYISSLPDESFVILRHEPFTSTRTFIINAISLSMAVLWLFASLFLVGKATNNHAKWPWAMVTAAICCMDIVSAVSYANDSRHTQTLVALVRYVGGSVYGIGHTDLDTKWAAWTMFIIGSRFVAVSIINISLAITVLVYDVRKPKVTPMVLQDSNNDTCKEDMATLSVLEESPSPEENNDVLNRRFIIPRPRPRRRERIYRQQRSPGDVWEQQVPAGVHQKRIYEAGHPYAGKRRETADDLQNQFPWTYVPPSEAEPSPDCVIPANSCGCRNESSAGNDVKGLLRKRKCYCGRKIDDVLY